MFNMIGKGYMTEAREKSILAGEVSVSNKDYLLMLLKGYTEDEVDKGLKLSVKNTLERLFELSITHVDFIEGYFTDIKELTESMEFFPVTSIKKNTSLLQALKSISAITPARIAFVKDIKELIPHNLIASLIFSALKKNYLGLPVEYVNTTQSEYPKEFLDGLRKAEKKRVLSGKLPSPILLGSFIYDNPEYTERLSKVFKEQAFVDLHEQFPEASEVYYIPNIPVYLSQMVAERYGSVAEFSRITGYTPANIRPIFLRAKYHCDDHMKQLAKFSKIDLYTLMYSAMIWCFEHYTTRSYKDRKKNYKENQAQRRRFKKEFQEAQDTPLPIIDFSDL